LTLLFVKMRLDLLADDDKFPHVADVRDAVRKLLKSARDCDREDAQKQPLCEANMRRYLAHICAWVISTQRKVTERDRVWIEQVLGFEVARPEFEAAVQELRSKHASLTPNLVLPSLLKAQLDQPDRERRIIDPCDSTIRHIETVVSKTASVLGLPYKMEVSLARRVSLQLRILMDSEVERLSGEPTKGSDNTDTPTEAGTVEVAARETLTTSKLS
jgi:hypothetical protein